MSKELEDIELELARVKLARERLAFEDELQKRERNTILRQGAVHAGSTVGTFSLRTLFVVRATIFGLVLMLLVFAIFVATVSPRPNDIYAFAYRFGEWLAYGAIPILILTAWTAVERWHAWDARDKHTKTSFTEQVSSRVISDFKSQMWFWNSMAVLMAVLSTLLLLQPDTYKVGSGMSVPGIILFDAISIYWLYRRFIKK